MRDTKLTLILLGVLAFLAVGFMLHILEPILVPFVIAVFLSRIFSPLNAALRQRRVPAALSILLVLILVSISILIFFWVLYTSAQSFKDALPQYQARLKEMLNGISGWVAASFPRIAARMQHYEWEKVVEVSSLTGFLAGTVGSVLLFLEDSFLVLLFLVFLLSGSEAFPAKLRRAFAPENAERLSAVSHNIEAQVRKYLLTKTVVNLVTGGLVALLFALFGVDFPLLWGLVTFLAHYIPSIGAVISVALPTIFLFLQFPPGTALLIALLSAGLQFFIGNVAEPRVMGESLDLSPLLVLLALIFWGWLWGPWGMVLAVPITSTLKIICENVEPLRPLATLMSSGAERRAQTRRERKAEAGDTRMPSGLT